MLGNKAFTDVVMFHVDIFGYIDLVYLVERVLLVKLLYESKGNTSAAFREFRRVKNL